MFNFGFQQSTSVAFRFVNLFPGFVVYRSASRSCSTAARQRNCSQPIDGDANVTAGYTKPFDAIPGPRSLPIVGTLWRYLPYIGEYQLDNLPKNGLMKMRKYGPLVREDILPGVPIVWVYTPQDIETVYRSEGRYPERRSHLALIKYRLDRPHIYNTGGLLPTNGAEWWRLRSYFQRHVSRIQDVRTILPDSDQVIRDFVLKRIRPGSVEDFLPELSRLFLELTCLAAFNERFNSFEESELRSDSVTSQLIEATWTINSCILATDNGLQLWKRFPKMSPLYRKLEKSHQFLEKIAIEQVSKKFAAIKNNKDHVPGCLIENYLLSKEVDKKDVIGMAVDLLLAGIDTMTYTSCFALYHIARNEEAEASLFNEAIALLCEGDEEITADKLSRASYTKAVIKETFRLNPIAVGVGRILHKDAVLSGYHVPKGTVVVTQNQVTCRLREYFPKPDEFLPERWLKSASQESYSPFLVLPFGHGPRTCIARRLAEQNLQALLLHVVRNYKLEWRGGDLNVKSLLINKPDNVISLEFKSR